MECAIPGIWFCIICVTPGLGYDSRNYISVLQVGRFSEFVTALCLCLCFCHSASVPVSILGITAVITPLSSFASLLPPLFLLLPFSVFDSALPPLLPLLLLCLFLSAISVVLVSLCSFLYCVYRIHSTCYTCSTSYEAPIFYAFNSTVLFLNFELRYVTRVLFLILI